MHTTTQLEQAAADQAGAVIAQARNAAAFTCIQNGLANHWRRSAERAMRTSEALTAQGKKAEAWEWLCIAAGMHARADDAAALAAATA
jgi:hypothetical protein